MGYYVLLMVDNGVISLIDYNTDSSVLEEKENELKSIDNTKTYIRKTELDKEEIKSLRTNVIKLREMFSDIL